MRSLLLLLQSLGPGYDVHMMHEFVDHTQTMRARLQNPPNPTESLHVFSKNIPLHGIPHSLFCETYSSLCLLVAVQVPSQLEGACAQTFRSILSSYVLVKDNVV